MHVNKQGNVLKYHVRLTGEVSKVITNEYGDLEVYLSDLTPTAVREFLRWNEVDFCREGNWDTIPIIVIPKGE